MDGELVAYPDQMIRHTSRAVGAHISARLARGGYDGIHVEGYYLMQHLPVSAPTPILLVEQNVEYLLARQRWEMAITPSDRSDHFVQYTRTMYWERRAWRRAKLCAAVTREDQQHMLASEPGLRVAYVPDGADHQPLVRGIEGPGSGPTIAADPEEPVVLFVGNFAYQPNVDAAHYLAEDILPRVLRDVPSARLLLVGNAPPPDVVAMGASPRITVTGFVPSLLPFLDAAHVVVCPLRIGGGVKVKMLEALHAGKPIVSTTIGAQGLELGADGGVRIDDDAAQFARSVAHLLSDPAERARMGEAARRMARRLPTWDRAAEELLRCYAELER